ncbi:PAS domain-containing sensor histidine kinase [Chlorogloeopsis sp. ULAP02]|uniref:sensor histidine kinase n=1 Tax=Chlorogloeopsis sp. ULAP02 TaxID=3107926 RepID=UPI0031351EB9
MSLNQPSSWHHSCQEQQNIAPVPPARLELVPERASDVEICTSETRRRIEDELLWYRNLYENTPCVYLTLDRNGIILSVNKQGANSLGYSPEELIHKPVFNLFTQSEQQRLFHALMRLFQEVPESEASWEFRLNCPVSKMQWAKVVARILDSGKDNQLVLMIFEDITAEKLFNCGFQENEQHLYLIANTLPVMLWVAGAEGSCNFLNQSWLEFTGSTRQQQQEFNWLEQVHPEDQDFCRQTYESAFNIRAKFQIEHRLKNLDGESRWILNTGLPRFNSSGKFIGYIGSAIDITERKLAELALKKSQKAAQTQLKEIERFNRLKDEFLSTVSHELRTPLTNMKMAIQMMGIALNKEHNLLLEMAKPYAERSKFARYFQILNNECEREINLINNFLDLQRLDTSTKPLVLEKIQVNEWLERVVELFKARNRNGCKHNLNLKIASNLPPLLCDPFSLERILIELLTNACKFSPPEADIIIAAQAKVNSIQLQVSNYGVEIPASELPHIFEKFYRIPSNDPWKQGGTGLGLALVQKLTKYLGGTIEVESKSNCTSLTVQLPL